MTLKHSMEDRSASRAGVFWRAFADEWAAGAPWGALCDRLELYWRALLPSSAGAEPAADRWRCHRVHARGACRAESSTSWALALRSGLWSPEDALASAAHLAPDERDAALKDCALFLPQGSRNLLFATLEAAESSRDRAWRALGGRLIDAGDTPLARDALQQITWPTLRVALLKDLAPKLDVRALAEEVDTAWSLICAATHPSREYLIALLTELIPLASARSERAAFVERWVLSLPERAWEISQDLDDLRVLAARAWAAAGDTDRALGAPRFAPHLHGAHRDGLWRWIVDRSGATDDADDILHLATAARDLFEGADDAFRERVHEEAATLARAFIERERPEEPRPIDRAAAIHHLRHLIANRAGVVGLVGSLAAAATPIDLEEMVSILAQVTWFSMDDSSAVWSAVAWRWQALGDFARAQEVTSRSEFDQYRAELRFQLALASSQDDHLLAAP
jgi:hypothetical protein